MRASVVVGCMQVILSTHAVVANGGLIALNGSHAVALAANDLSVPVVCVTGLFKVNSASIRGLVVLLDLSLFFGNPMPRSLAA